MIWVVAALVIGWSWLMTMIVAHDANREYGGPPGRAFPAILSTMIHAIFALAIYIAA